MRVKVEESRGRLKKCFFGNLLCRAGHPSFRQASWSGAAARLTTVSVIPGSAHGLNWPSLSSVWLHKNSHKKVTASLKKEGEMPCCVIFLVFKGYVKP